MQRPEEPLLLLEHLNGVAWIADAETRAMSYVSPRALLLVGADAIATVDDWCQHACESDRARLRDACLAAAERSAETTCSYRTIGSGAGARMLRTELHPFERAGERRRQLLAYTTDITEEHEQKRWLARAEVILDKLVTNGPVAVFAIDSEGRFSYARGGPKTRLANHGRVAGIRVFDLYGDVPWLVTALRGALAGERGMLQGEVDGATWDIYFTPMRDENGTVTGVVGVAMDGVLRKRAEEALFKVFHASPVAISITKLEDGQFIEVNESFVRMFGYAREEVLGRSSLELGLWDRASDRARILEILDARNYVRAFESTARAKNGETLEVAVFMERIELAGKSCLVGLFLDITQRKRTESELSALYIRARQLDELKARLTANVSHELRTPLSVIVSLAERIADDAPNVGSTARVDAHTIVKNARQVLKNVNDLLDVSRLEARAMPISYSRVNLAQLVARVAASFEPLATNARIALRIETPPELEAEVDPEMLSHVLSNLLSNALKHAPADGRVRCSLGERDGRAIIEVADNGPGVRESDREAIFERYVQVDRGGWRRGGSGLGLPIARDLSALHGGRVSVGDAPEGGASFVVDLPLRAPPGTQLHPAPDEPAVDAALTQAPVAPGTVGSSAAALEGTPPAARADLPRVLLVEDNDDLSRLIAEVLSPHFDVHRAGSAEAALEMLSRARPDVIVTDLMLGAMSGEEMVREIRTRGGDDDTPILVLTGRAEDELRARLLTIGAQDYVLKPCSRAELIARVGNWVATKRARSLLRDEVVSRSADIEVLAHELARRRHELEATAVSLRAAREQAEDASRMKSDFLSMVSHELRTPLMSIQLQVHMLERAASTFAPQQRAALARMSRGCTRLLALVESLLEYARSQTGRLIARPETFDLTALAAEVIDEIRPEALRKNLEIRLQAQGPNALRSDKRLVRIILTNLIGNAVKFTERGFVRVEIAPPGAMQLIAVADSGIGIAEDEQKGVFEPFRQIEPLPRKHTPGFGLGLALVRQLCDALGGTIELTSRVGVGSTFVVRLPSARESFSEVNAEAR